LAAAPLVAGITALVGEARGTLEPKLLNALLSTTSKPLAWRDLGTTHLDILAPVPQQGAGLVQAFDAAYTTLVLNTSGISFNDTEHFASHRIIAISNLGDEDVTIEVGDGKAATINTFLPGSEPLLVSGFPDNTVDGWAELSFSPRYV
jgi:hypothetical protein